MFATRTADDALGMGLVTEILDGEIHIDDSVPDYYEFESIGGECARMEMNSATISNIAGAVRAGQTVCVGMPNQYADHAARLAFGDGGS